jgi:hypothetical protein
VDNLKLRSVPSLIRKVKVSGVVFKLPTTPDPSSVGGERTKLIYLLIVFPLLFEEGVRGWWDIKSIILLFYHFVLR